MERTGKSYTVKEWFANKVAQELQRNIDECEVFGILKETDKAIYAMLKIGVFQRKTMWVPKSVLIERVAGETDEVTGECYAETYRFDSYEEATFEYKLYWKDFV